MGITIKKRTFYLLVIMLLVTLIVAGISIALIYNVVIDQRKERLQMLCENQASFIKSLSKETKHDKKKIIEILNTQFNYIGTMYKTSEFVIACREKDSIIFITRFGNFTFSKPRIIPFNSNYAIPIKYALDKNTGFIRGSDYSMSKVMAYCTYIPELEWGIVAKIDMSEVRTPFQEAALIAFISTLLLVTAGVFIFRRISDPILKKIIESEEKYRNIVNTAQEGIVIDSPDGVMIFVNQKWADMLGYPAEEIIGKNGLDFMDDDQREAFLQGKEQLKEGKNIQREYKYRRKDGSVLWVISNASQFLDGKEQHLVNLAMLSDISDRKRAEEEKQITIGFLSLVTQCKNTTNMIKAAVTFFQEQSGCEAVGIRLKEGNDYPYYEAHGFPDEFIKNENELCSRDKNGNIIRDYTGNPVIDCMCGNVICGRFDPSKSFFTEGGSFWSNSTTELLATTTDADRQSRTRNRCNGEGYESVALIPIHVGDERFGLIQLNDCKYRLNCPL